MNPKKIGLLVFAGAAIAMFFSLDLGQTLTLATLKANHQALMAYYATNKETMEIGFMAIYIIQTTLCLPGAALLSLAAGALFDTLMGTVYAVSAATIGATLAFIMTRYLLHDLVQSKFGTQFEGINREMDKRGFNYLLFLRLVPAFPFFVINAVAGVCRVPLKTFILATFVGIIPGSYAFAWLGRDMAAPGAGSRRG